MPFTIKEILRMQVAPALGCTEPVAIALAAAAAVSLLPGGKPGRPDIARLDIAVDPNIYKNGLAVAIPGAPDLSGLDTAAALGACGGDPSKGLEVLAPLDQEAIRRAQAMLDQGKVHVELLADRRGLYIEARAVRGADTAEARIEAVHDNIVHLALNGEELADHPLKQGRAGGGASALPALEAWLKERKLDELVALLDDLDREDRDFLREGVDRNMRLAEHGLKHGSGMGVGRALDRLHRQKLLCRDMIQAARILASAAADARMGGVKLPAMSSAGSGNHGLTAILPIWAVKDFVNCDEDTVLEAIALSHVVTAYVKAWTGRLSAVCGCSVAAGAGAAAGTAYLLGGTSTHMAGAIANLVEDLAGVICDGAKAGCALKLATAAGTAVQAALFALQGVTVRATDGIVAASPEQTMQNVGELSTKGMIETDRTILAIMLAKRIAPEL